MAATYKLGAIKVSGTNQTLFSRVKLQKEQIERQAKDLNQAVFALFNFNSGSEINEARRRCWDLSQTKDSYEEAMALVKDTCNRPSNEEYEITRQYVTRIPRMTKA